MALDLGEVSIDVQIGPVARVLVAATQLHDAIYYSDNAVVDALPDEVRKAFGEMQQAIKRMRDVR